VDANGVDVTGGLAAVADGSMRPETVGIRVAAVGMPETLDLPIIIEEAGMLTTLNSVPGEKDRPSPAPLSPPRANS
jgi:hypothetical protein